MYHHVKELMYTVRVDNPDGETDMRGRWNTDGFDFEESPVLASLSESSSGSRRLRT